MLNRAPRCNHGFYSMLCVVVGCAHFDGGAADSAPALPGRTKPTYRGASAAVRALLLGKPARSNPEVAALCECSLSLVGLVRRQLGLQRHKR